MNELFNTEDEIKESIAEVISQNIKNKALICDVGFDNVYLIKKLNSKNKQFFYHGIDIFDEVVDIAQKYIKEQNLNNCLIDKIPFGQFDKKDFNVCICVRLFHHFSKEDTVFFLKKMIETINYNGEIYLSDSIRDFNGRSNRYSYTPYFYLNEISKIIGCNNLKLEYSEDAMLNVGEIWIMKLTISNNNCVCKLLKTNNDINIVD